MGTIIRVLLFRLFFSGFDELDLQIEKFQRLRDSCGSGSGPVTAPGLFIEEQGDATTG